MPLLPLLPAFRRELQVAAVHREFPPEKMVELYEEVGCFFRYLVQKISSSHKLCLFPRIHSHTPPEEMGDLYEEEGWPALNLWISHIFPLKLFLPLQQL